MVAIALAIGAGAIAQVIVELIAYLYRISDNKKAPLLAGNIVSGMLTGFAVMFATAMLV